MVDQLVRFDTHIDYVYLGSTAQETWKCDQVHMSYIVAITITIVIFDQRYQVHRRNWMLFPTITVTITISSRLTKTLPNLTIIHRRNWMLLPVITNHHHNFHPKPPSILTIIIKGGPPPLHGLGPQAGHCEASAQRK